MAEKTNFEIRYPSQAQLPFNSEESKFWDDRIGELTKKLYVKGFDIRHSSGDIKIRLAAGGKRSIHSQNKRTEGFAWFGEPTPGELMKAISVVVGIQVMDDAVHMPAGSPFNKLETARVKPNILYLPSDTPNLEKNGYKLLHDQINTLIEEGTINGKTDNIDKLFKIVRTPEEFIEAMHEQKAIKQSIHNGEPHNVDIDAKLLKLGEHVLDKSVKRPDFCGIVYTSANPKQPPEAVKEANLLGQFLAESGIGLITGAGKSGLMGAVHEGCVIYNGYSEGYQCPYIVKQEGFPEALSKLVMTPDIYGRMGAMFKQGEFAVVGGGGRGGSGTDQEALVGLYLLTSKLNRYGMKNREERLGYSNIAQDKPIEIIFDNREKLWGPTIEIFRQNGLEDGKNFHVKEGSVEVFKTIEEIRERTYKMRTEEVLRKHGIRK